MHLEKVGKVGSLANASFPPFLLVFRAIELKHNPSLVSALANETSRMYITASDSLGSLDQKIFGHWRVYLALKSQFYMSYVRLTFIAVCGSEAGF